MNDLGLWGFVIGPLVAFMLADLAAMKWILRKMGGPAITITIRTRKVNWDE